MPREPSAPSALYPTYHPRPALPIETIKKSINFFANAMLYMRCLKLYWPRFLFIILIYFVFQKNRKGTFCGLRGKQSYTEDCPILRKGIPPSRYGNNRTVYVSKAALRLPRRGIFCFVVTGKKYFKDRVPAVNSTWLPRMDHGQFFTTEKLGYSSIPYSTVFRGFNDSYEMLFHKTIEAFYYSYANISTRFDWYMKADDDTYVHVPNLRKFLSRYDPKVPYYIGSAFKPFLKHGYNAGGAGYLLSHAAMRIFIERVYPKPWICPFHEYEDVGFAKCLEKVGIFPIDDRNHLGQHRFLPYNLSLILNGFLINKEYAIYEEKKGTEAIPADLVTMHHVKPDDIRSFDAIINIVK